MTTGRCRFLAAAALALLTSCTSEERGRRALEAAGYTEINPVGSDWGCAAFDAKGPSGKPAKVSACCGQLAGCTFRMRD